RDNIGISQAHLHLFGGMLLRLPKLLSKKVKG
ncbi:MAG: glycosyltransferase family 2 protein, partial [Acinetobacter sp.]